MIHISTDQLFSGNKEFMIETDITEPLNVYGRTKLQAEEEVLRFHSGAMVIRTNFYGWGHAYRRSFSDWVIDSLLEHRPIDMYYDVYYTPTLIDHVVSAIHSLYDISASGIINVVGENRISKYALAEEFGLDSGRIKKCSVNKHYHKARRPKDMSLSNGKAVELIGMSIGSLSEGLRLLRKQKEAGRPDYIKNAVV
jgi:dTDP-4-dehydrorhamnose reductase